MLDEAEYASDTDESDEDYRPDADGENVVSENESDGEPENAPDDDGDDNVLKTKRRSRKRTASKVSAPADSKRNKSDASAAHTVTSKSMEKDELVDDDDPENEEALWASFLGNAGQTALKAQASSTKSSKVSTFSSSSSSSSSANGSSTKKQIIDKAEAKTPTVNVEKKRIVTEIFEFAGEKVEVQKEVKICEEKPTPSKDAKSIESNKCPVKSAAVTLPALNRRSGGGGGGLSSVLGQLGKKNKLSVLEKTKLDWNGFKRTEGIDEELQTHNKGRDGYLERQDFLQRTDVRQFEIEKSMRQTNRRK